MENRWSVEDPSTSTWVADNFFVKEQIGSGAFGRVYRVVTTATREDKQKEFALKALMRTIHPKYVAMELRVLQSCIGLPNIMQIQAAHRDRDRIFVAMSYFPHDKFKDVVRVLEDWEIVDYMKNLLIALHYLHSRGFVHRDIKPSNFLYNRTLKRYSLIDFGLAQEDEKFRQINRCQKRLATSNLTDLEPRTKRLKLEYSTGQDLREGGKGVSRLLFSPAAANSNPVQTSKRSALSPRKKCLCLENPQASICPTCSARPTAKENRAGTAGFRAPEVLLRAAQQCSKSDIWAAGVILLSLCCKTHPVLRPSDDYEALGQLVALFGSAAVQTLATRLGGRFRSEPALWPLDLNKFCKAMLSGDLETMGAKKEDCAECRGRLLLGTGNCLCAVENDIDFDSDPILPAQFFLLRNALKIDPVDRYSADMLLSSFP